VGPTCFVIDARTGRVPPVVAARIGSRCPRGVSGELLDVAAAAEATGTASGPCLVGLLLVGLLLLPEAGTARADSRTGYVPRCSGLTLLGETCRPPRGETATFASRGADCVRSFAAAARFASIFSSLPIDADMSSAAGD